MSLETDLLLDRRQLSRRLVFWRVAAVVALVLVVLAVARPRLPALAGRHVARLNITGIISDDRKLVAAVDRAANDRHVAALLVSIESPGGSVGGGEALHDAIARVAAKKPVVAVMRGMAASAGYMVALPAQRIFAREATLTGSIGVLLETPEISGLLDKVGVNATTLVSGPLKDQPSFTHPLSADGRVVLQGIVADMYDMFVEMVASGRHMDVARVRQLADGRAYTGRQAKQLGLIDAFGGEQEARDWLRDQLHDNARLPVSDLKKEESLRDRMLGAKGASDALGLALGHVLAGAARGATAELAPNGGLMAIWQPGTAASSPAP